MSGPHGGPSARWLAVGALLTACSSAGPADADVGPYHDATVVDSTLTTDAAGDATFDGAADGGAVACGGRCDPLALGGCATGMRCTFDHGVPTCEPRSIEAGSADAGLGAAGASCHAESDCATGLACFAGTAPGAGVCVAVCCPSAAQCDATTRCRGDGTLVDGVSTAWARCLPALACDLAHPEHSCATREGCYIVDQMAHTECLIAGSVPAGGACASASDCVPGYACTGLTGRSCVRICFLASTAPHQGCGDTEHCQAQAYSPNGSGICTPG